MTGGEHASVAFGDPSLTAPTDLPVRRGWGLRRAALARCRHRARLPFLRRCHLIGDKPELPGRRSPLAVVKPLSEEKHNRPANPAPDNVTY